MRKSFVILSALVLVTSLAACGGSDTTIKTGEVSTTGQQLIDLQKARDAGAITEKEYDKQKQKILKGN
jgi:hypothetical protein